MDADVIADSMRTLLILAFVFGVSFSCQAFTAKATSYTGHEDGNFLNSLGGKLDETQCAADLRYYHRGQRVRFTYATGHSEVRTITDCGSAVKGRYHFDIYRKSMASMRKWGTCRVEVTLL